MEFVVLTFRGRVAIFSAVYVFGAALLTFSIDIPAENRQPVIVEQVASVDEVPTYIIDAGYSDFTDGPNGESFSISVDSRPNAKKEKIGYLALVLRVKNQGKVTIDAPYFHLYNDGESCGDAVLEHDGSLWLIRAGKTKTAVLLFACPNPIVDKTALQLAATYYDAEFQWVYEQE
jgi:hypothetical protein